MPRIGLLLLIATATLVGLNPAQAESLGVWGRTYPIKERDAIAVMKDAVRQKMANGGREAMLKGAQERYLASLENVATPPGISTAKVNATRWVDLTHTVTDTITDGRGALVVAAGTKINPLAVLPMKKKLFFIDAKDPKQVHLAKAHATPEDKVILLGGSVFKAAHALGSRVYLDVPGLHSRMKIRHLPSVVSQEGVLLKVQEVAP